MKTKLKLSIALLSLFSAAIGLFLPTKTFAVTTITFQDNVTTIPITRVIENVTNPVTNTFNYEITANSGNPAAVTNLPSSTSIQFNAVSPNSSHKATATGNINFANVGFTKPGDYFFTVRETSSTYSAYYPVDSTEYTAIASVRFGANTDTLVVTLLQNVKNSSGEKVPASWSSTSSRTYFEISASTTGNVADLDLCFNYVVNIPVGNGVAAGDSFAVSTSSSCSGNPSEIVANTDTTISLKNGDTIQVGLTGNTNQLPIGSGYSIKLSDAHGYIATFNGSTMTVNVAQTVSNLVAVNDPNFNSANKAAIVLTKDSDVYTGIVNNIWAYVVILAIGTAGIIVTVNQIHHRKK